MQVRCSVCGKLFEASQRGRRYCSNACRQLAYRERGKLRFHGAPGVKPEIDEIADVQRALMEARRLVNRFAELSQRATPALRPGCKRVSRALYEAIEREGW